MADEQRGNRLQRVVKLVAAGLLVAAIVKELRTPAEQRTWHGSIVAVPYDLRPPTPARLRAAWWKPEDPRLFTPRAFGVGWALNLARVRQALSKAD
jgi:hypothetical protein